jgi:glutathione peroxidase
MRLFLSLALAIGALTTMATADDHECALDFKVETIDDETVDLEDYEGNVVLVVNTASECGLTPQYAGLQELYSYLTGKDAQPAGKGDISWNFEKFLIDREGNLIHRFAPRTKPSDVELVKAIESELANK